MNPLADSNHVLHHELRAGVDAPHDTGSLGTKLGPEGHVGRGVPDLVLTSGPDARLIAGQVVLYSQLCRDPETARWIERCRRIRGRQS